MGTAYQLRSYELSGFTYTDAIELLFPTESMHGFLDS